MEVSDETRQQLFDLASAIYEAAREASSCDEIEARTELNRN